MQLLLEDSEQMFDTCYYDFSLKNSVIVIIGLLNSELKSQDSASESFVDSYMEFR